jgi:hypothetical protein
MFALVPNQPFDYVLERHRSQPEAERPTWVLRSLPSRLIAELSRLLEENKGRAIWVSALAGLVGWRNVSDPWKGHAGRRVVHGIDFEGGVDADLLDRVPFDVLSEIATAILEANTLDRDTSKN